MTVKKLLPPAPNAVRSPAAMATARRIGLRLPPAVPAVPPIVASEPLVPVGATDTLPSPADALAHHDCPTLTNARAAFADSLIARSPRTAVNYQSALNRLIEFLEAAQPFSGGQRREIGLIHTDELPGDILERFYGWLLRTYGREHRPTAVAYLAEVRSFFRFLDRKRWLHPDLSYERMRGGLRELVGRVPYHTPRIDDAIALVVTSANALPLPAPDGKNQPKRLEILRNKAILATLYGTALRRAEVSSLNRTDVQDGRLSQGLVTGKGSKERVVFFDDASLEAIRVYLAARSDNHLPLFLRHDDGRGEPGRGGEAWRLSPQSVWGVVKRQAKAIDVEATTHNFRHLKARTLLNNGAQLAEVQDILGHASPETTKRIYAPYTTQHLREAFDMFSLPVEEIARRVEEQRAERSVALPEHTKSASAKRQRKRKDEPASA